jgi:hypothetical protein
MNNKIDLEYVPPKDWKPFVRVKKRNVSVPLEAEDIDLADKVSAAFNINRAVILRMCIQFALKNKIFLETIEQL